MYRYTIALLLAMSLSIVSTAQSKVVTLTEAGTLHTQLTDSERLTLTELTVTGSINYMDVALLREMSTLGALTTISLQDASWSREPVADLLLDQSEYFLPNVDILGKEWEASGGEAWEVASGHRKNPDSMPGFWTFYTDRDLFFMTGYMNGWEGTINEVCLKTEHEEYVRSPEMRAWVEGMGYTFQQMRDDGDDIYYNDQSGVWLLMHYTPYNASDYPGIHFSSETYIY